MRAGCAGGGKGALISREKSLSLLNHNEQVLFVPDKARSLTARNDGSPCAGGLGYQVEQMPTLTSAESGTQRPTVAVYDMTHADEVMRPVEGGKCQTLNARMGTGGNQVPVVSSQKSVRRLTPTECERLQGLPDGYTLIDDKTCSDTARYRALGNGMAQPCADYVVRRIREATT